MSRADDDTVLRKHAGGMGNPRIRNRRVLRLAIAGLLSAILVLWVATVLVVPQRRPHGRVPDLSAVRSTSRTDGRLAHVVSVVAGRGAVVHCWSRADWKKRASEQALRSHGRARHGPWSAYTSYRPYPTVHLSPEICIELTRLGDLSIPVWEDESPDALAWSVHALAHESVHITGWLNEAMAECLGMQAIGRAAVALGRTPREGRYLAERYWTHWYPWSKRAYRSVECRDGARSICALKATSGRERPARLADFVHSPRVDKRMSLGFSRVGFAVSASDARSRPRAND